ncbi:MAG: hypothetical protein Q9211_000879 [Gyalolechia sp. 1 TL-2023]
MSVIIEGITLGPRSLGSEIELCALGPRAATTTPQLRSTVVERQSGDVIQHATNEPLPGPQPSVKTNAVRFSRLRSTLIVVTLAGLNSIHCIGSGILTVALPRIGRDIHLEESLLLWPALVYALAAGCLLLIFGAVADVFGAKLVWVTGSFLYVVFTLAVGLSQTGLQIIVFRTLLGVAVAMCLPTAVSLTTNTFPRGNWRNIAFASLGMGQPIGYSVGLILGGIFTDTIGWRWGFYASAIVNCFISFCALWALPSVHHPTVKPWTRQLKEDIDWVGALILSIALGILLYVLAMTTSSYRRFSDIQNIVLFTFSLLLLIAFPVYMNYQVRRSKPAIIPNKLWRNVPFAATCIAVFFCWAAFNGLQYFSTL